MRSKTKLYASGVLLFCIVMVIGYFAIWTNRTVTVYDDNFKILYYRISKGTTHTIYQGNQTVGRMRDKLKHQFGLKFIGDSHLSLIKMCESRVFLLRYSGDFTFEELDGLRAVLTNDKNIFKELAVMKMYALDENTFIRGYLLPRLPTSNDSFRIDFKLKSADDPIVSCRVGELYRHNGGFNSEQ
jgi:hypothetical protein